MNLASLLLVAGLSAASATSALQTDAAVSLKERPVMKVVRLLQDTKAELEKELEDDKAVHELMDCWCNSNNQEKTAAIAASNGKIAEMESIMGTQSCKIFGILGQMKEDFQANLKEAQKAEAKSKTEYETLKAAKEDEIETGRKLIVSVDQQIANA